MIAHTSSELVLRSLAHAAGARTHAGLTRDAIGGGSNMGGSAGGEDSGGYPATAGCSTSQTGEEQYFVRWWIF